MTSKRVRTKIGVGIIGASANRGWALAAHIPALKALPNYEIRAVSTSRGNPPKRAREPWASRLPSTITAISSPGPRLIWPSSRGNDLAPAEVLKNFQEHRFGLHEFVEAKPARLGAVSEHVVVPGEHKIAEAPGRHVPVGMRFKSILLDHGVPERLLVGHHHIE